MGCDFLNWQGIDWNNPQIIYGTIDSVQNFCESNPNSVKLITTKSDLLTLQATTNIGILLSLEGSASIDSQFTHLHNYFRLGLRSIALTHNYQNQFGLGCKEQGNAGLSDLGIQLVQEITRLPMILDLVHVNERTFFDALDIYNKPPIVSHSNTKTQCNHFRNLTDDQISAVADRGGVIGVNFMSELIDEDINKATADRLIDHIDHLVAIAGIDHVGLGPDYTDYFTPEFQEKYPDGIKNIEEFPYMKQFLSHRGYASSECEKIMGDNFLRVLNQVLP